MIRNFHLFQKTLAIVDGIYLPFDPFKSCQGGSETWILETAKAFIRNNWHVIVFANVKSMIIYEGIEFLPFNILPYRCRYQIFDLVIFSRAILFIDQIISKNNYFIFHDVGFIRPVTQQDLDKIDKFYFLSNYQKQYITNRYNRFLNIQDEKSYFIYHGVDHSLYKIKCKKEHSMVWSVGKERGFDFFINYVMPEILLNVPDFILHVCSYSDYTYNEIKQEIKNHIVFHGKLEKNKLAELQCKSKIWCYPNLGYPNYDISNDLTETFSLTAIENLVAENIIIAGDIGGLQASLKDYPLLGKEFYNNDNKIPLEKLSEYGKYLAKYCIDALLDKYKPEYKGDINKFTWDNVFKEFTNKL